MKKFHFTTQIQATKEKVWDTLWQDENFRKWADLVDNDMYIKGELKEGNEVEFISGSSGYGVTSLVEKFEPNEYAFFKHLADTKDSGSSTREKEWTGGSESYTLVEDAGVTELTIEFDIPPEQEEYFETTFPKALAEIKRLAETS